MTTTRTDEAWRATLEIQELISRFDHAADAGDGKALAATLRDELRRTPDGWWFSRRRASADL